MHCHTRQCSCTLPCRIYIRRAISKKWFFVNSWSRMCVCVSQEDTHIQCNAGLQYYTWYFRMSQGEKGIALVTVWYIRAPQSSTYSRGSRVAGEGKTNNEPYTHMHIKVARKRRVFHLTAHPFLLLLA